MWRIFCKYASAYKCITSYSLGEPWVFGILGSCSTSLTGMEGNIRLGKESITVVVMASPPTEDVINYLALESVPPSATQKIYFWIFPSCSVQIEHPFCCPPSPKGTTYQLTTGLLTIFVPTMGRVRANEGHGLNHTIFNTTQCFNKTKWKQVHGFPFLFQYFAETIQWNIGTTITIHAHFKQWFWAQTWRASYFQ